MPKQISLSGLMDLRVPDFNNKRELRIIKDKEGNPVLGTKGNKQKVLFKAVIRTSNSVYYPLITNSLYLPAIEIKKEIKDKIKTLHQDAGFSAEEIQAKINNEQLQLTISQIEEVMLPENQDFIKEVDYRLKEYQYLTTKESLDDKDLVFEKENSNELIKFGITNILKINRLKLTSVQTGYSRQEPIDKDLFENSTMEDFIHVNEHAVKAKYTTSKGKNTNILPGIESFGEGIFIDFDKSKIVEWYKKQYKNHSFKKRIETLKNNAETSSYRLSEEKEKIFSNMLIRKVPQANPICMIQMLSLFYQIDFQNAFD